MIADDPWEKSASETLKQTSQAKQDKLPEKQKAGSDLDPEVIEKFRKSALGHKPEPIPLRK